MESSTDSQTGGSSASGTTTLSTTPTTRSDSPRMNRFYDKIRKNIEATISGEQDKPGRGSELLLLVPDIFALLWRLVNDPRVSGKNKVLLGSGIAYFILPIDLLPESLVGGIGYLDDVIFSIYILNKLLSDTDEEILREHWSGSGDILDTIKRALNSTDGIAKSDVIDRVKKMMK